MNNSYERNDTPPLDFEAIRLRIASPADIHRWSFGEVLRPETINYRTQKPEKDGLFSERIFGPTKDWECYCGKYKKVRYKGIVCDKCGVEVTRSIVRRERMGHIDLATPVSHIWFLRGVPSKIGTLLDISVQNLEKVIYFASFIVSDVNDELKEQTIEQLRQEYKNKKHQMEVDFNKKANETRTAVDQNEKLSTKQKASAQLSGVNSVEAAKEKEIAELEASFKMEEEELKNLKPLRIMSEESYREMSMKYGHIFEAGIGAEAIQQLLARMDLEEMERTMKEQGLTAQGLKKEKLIRRAILVKNLRKNNIRPEWMIMTTVPIIPPDLRPMVALDGGRFATSDLNDLYRRVINRNNRLKQLVDLRAPEVICRNERRMLQEAVDALIDNSARHGKTVVASTGQKRTLKSLADMLKGKRGRFRQNLLGKRIDYSGRSVIVVGPKLQLGQCGLPKRMALELFKPFVISKLIQREYVYNVRSASRFIESGRDEVWDILEEVVDGAYVMLNRAPTLHRLGIQAFRPVLIEGKAIQVHPMVCAAFNADFDGDQMAVHVPLSDEAREEAGTLMLASHNLLKPATGAPIAQADKDIVLGAFYMTSMHSGQRDNTEGIKYFDGEQEAKLAYSTDAVGLRDKIRIRVSPELEAKLSDEQKESHILETTVGRILFNDLLENEVGFYNKELNKKTLGEIVSLTLEYCGQEKTAKLLDDMKDLCFSYLTASGLSFSIFDIPLIEEKPGCIKDAEQKISEVEQQYDMGLLTFAERRIRIISIWTEARDKIYAISEHSLDENNSIYSIIQSGARGSWSQMNQMIGMKGLMANPSGDIIELAVKSSFKEGLGILEFFISTHGARKGLADTALRTSNAGYLTRRLVDVAQDVVTGIGDCGTKEGLLLTKKESDAIDVDFYDRLLARPSFETISDSDGSTIIEKDEIFTKVHTDILREKGVEEVTVRSLITCKSIRGVCVACYGTDLATSASVVPGMAVGILAAQSLGEPGTQLTMRTFHTGGVAGADITQGLPRVEELFEARIPKVKAVISEVTGKVSISEKKKTMVDAKGKEIALTSHGQKVVSVHYDEVRSDLYKFKIPRKAKVEGEAPAPKKVKKGDLVVKVKEGDAVHEGDTLFVTEHGIDVKSLHTGTITVEKDGIKVIATVPGVREYVIPALLSLWVNEGDLVNAGDQLTEGAMDLQLLYDYKGKLEAQKYIMNGIQYIYASQAGRINDKHLEIIARQMFSRVQITDSGDTDLLPGEIIERSEWLEANEEAKKTKGKPALAQELLMGITKASLSTRSWLSAASFQETARVLINAAVTGKVDHLEGLKENVIIGRLIPVGTGYATRRNKH
ncbi:MAG: DNA-directed RNA polymerase subunit beta' [bacterium]|nr:DNA-directed RNA polymerase subunit beta' [bacterium]